MKTLSHDLGHVALFRGCSDKITRVPGVALFSLCFHDVERQGMTLTARGPPRLVPRHAVQRRHLSGRGLKVAGLVLGAMAQCSRRALRFVPALAKADQLCHGTPPPRMTRPSAHLLLFALGLFGTSRLTAAESLRAEVSSVATPPRPEAPLWLDVKLTSKSSVLREGALEFTHYCLGSPSWTYTTQEIALIGGTQSFRFLLPPSQRRQHDDVSIRLRFLEKGAALDLGRFSITTLSRPGFPLTVATGPASARGVAEMRPTWMYFRLERFPPSRFSGASALFATGAAVIEPGDFPTDPMGYCAFDAVLLEGKDFAQLKAKSLDALGAWVAAGGSLLVSTDMAFDASHAAALRGWVQSDPEAAPVEFNSNGKLLESQDGFSFARVGFGRLALVPERPSSEQEYDTPRWRQAAAWMWRLRREQMESVIGSGELKYTAGDFPDAREFDYRFSELVRAFTESLLPKTVRIIPPSVVFALLAAFVFLIGPVDWWVLGRIRARRFTWLLFPAVTVGVTAITMKLARHYLGEDIHRGSVVFTDLAADGRVVRETRLDLLLPPERSVQTVELQHAFCMPVERRGIALYGVSDPERIPRLSFKGSFPGRFAFSQPVQQWAPVLTRQTRIGGGEDTSRVRWDGFRREMLERVGAGEIAQAIAGDSGCRVAVISPVRVAAADFELIKGQFLDALTYAPPHGGTAYLSLLSPSGSGSLNDLGCIERGDTQSSLVVAARRDGSNLHIWRRLYLH